MKEQLRTEAEKVLQENYTESIKGIESISTPHFPKAYNDCAIKSMLDFHAQQSKDRDVFTIAFTDWVVYESCCSSATKGKSITELLEIYKSNNLKK